MRGIELHVKVVRYSRQSHISYDVTRSYTHYVLYHSIQYILYMQRPSPIVDGIALKSNNRSSA